LTKGAGHLEIGIDKLNLLNRDGSQPPYHIRFQEISGSEIHLNPNLASA